MFLQNLKLAFGQVDLLVKSKEELIGFLVSNPISQDTDLEEFEEYLGSARKFEDTKYFILNEGTLVLRCRLEEGFYYCYAIHNSFIISKIMKKVA